MKEQLFRELAGAPGLVEASVSAEGKGFAVTVKFGSSQRILATSRGKVRLFASLDTAGAFIRDAGIAKFEVDMTRYQRGRLRNARPDRAEALRLTRTKMQQEPFSFLRQ